LLNDTADSLSQLHKNTLAFDVAGTSISILGGIVASIAVTGGAALPSFLAGAGQAGGTVTSIFSQQYKETRTKEMLAELNDILKEDAEDMIEIRRLMKTFEQVEQRLNKFLPLLNKIVQIGIAAFEGLINISEVGQEKAVIKAMHSIKNILSDDNVITFLNRQGSVPSAGLRAPTNEKDWTSEIYIFKFVLGVANMALPLITPSMLAPVRCVGGLADTGASVAPGILESAGGLAHTGASVAPNMLENAGASVAGTGFSLKAAKTTFVLLNVLAIGIDILHLVQVNEAGKRQERYIQQMREVAKELQSEVDKMKDSNVPTPS